jgi:hypothetical protein
MRTRIIFSRRAGGYALALTMLFLAIMLAMLASLTRLTYTQSSLTERNNLYNASISAAEAATEMAIGKMDRDFINQSVNSDLSAYQKLTPETLQSGWPMQFAFSDGSGANDVTGVESLGSAVTMNLNSQFSGLYGLVMPFRVTSSARPLNRLYDLSATVSQDIQLASIPVFQFAIFYTLDLEINPGAKMAVNGKVHSNGTIYTAPENSLTYDDAVTAVGQIFNHRDPNDPNYDNAHQKPTYDAQHIEKVSALTLPVGANNDPASVRQILEPPPSGEDPNSAVGKERYYNKADLIVTTDSSGNVSVKTGGWHLFTVIPPDTTNKFGKASYSFIKTDQSFKDYREGKTVSVTDIDVSKLNMWLKNPTKGGEINDLADGLEGHSINSIYVEDQRPPSSGELTAVRVGHGPVLPDDGLTVATELPMYVQGNFNLSNGKEGSSDTSKSKPASLVGDAITILSNDWQDDHGKNVSAANTTVNAALISGIVKTTKTAYSGGVENFVRLLENWSGKTLTYNGSMVVMFESQYATNEWSYGSYYTAPNRKWAFDVNFLDQSKLPPGTPQVRKLVRGQWTISGSEK